MMQQMTWEEVYQLWKRGLCYFPAELNTSVSVETVHVPYPQEKGCFYGYDWLENAKTDNRKHIIKDDVASFLLFTTPSNKGTIHTAEMLASAGDEEERAAIWIAATTFELRERTNGNMHFLAYAMNRAACEFLQERYYVWHHATKRLIPDMILPWTILDNLVNVDASLLMNLIQTNVLLLKGTYSILLYSSLPDGEKPKYYNGVRK